MSSEALTVNDLANILEKIVAIEGTDMTTAEVQAFVDSLSIEELSIVDSVVEQGTSGIWTYRKWATGIAECWGRTDIVVPSNGAYVTPFPTDLFASLTSCVVIPWYGSTANRNATKYIITDGSGYVSSQWQAVAYVRDYAGNAVNPYIGFSWHAFGTWNVGE